MAEKLTSHDLYGDDSRLVLLDKQLKGINAELDKLPAKAKAMNDALKGANSATPSGQKAIVQAASDADKIIQKEQQLLNLRTQNAQKTALLTEQIRRQRAENAANARATLAGAQGYEYLNAQLTVALVKWKALTRELGTNHKETLEAARNVKILREQLKALDASTGLHVRNVGNYRSALGGVLSSVKQLAAAYFGLNAAQDLVRNIFNQTKAIDGLDKAYQQVLVSSDKVRDAQNFVSDASGRLGLNLLNAGKSYLRFRVAAEAGNLTTAQTNTIFEKAAKASSFLALSVEDQNGVFRAFEQIISKGTVQAEELRGQLGDRLPGAFIIAARAMGVSTAELNKMLKAGQVVASEFLPKFADELEKTFNLQNVNRIDNLAAAQARFSLAFTDLVRKINAGGAFTSFFRSLEGLVRGVGDVFDYFAGNTREAAEAAAEFVRSESGINAVLADSVEEANGLFGALSRLEPKSEARIRLMGEINTKYGEYLPNLLTEKSSLEDIAAAQELVNKKLKERALIESFQKATEPFKEDIARLTGALVEQEILQAKLQEAIESGNDAILGETLNALRDSPFAGGRDVFDNLLKGIESQSGQKVTDFINTQLNTTKDGLTELEDIYKRVADRLKISFDVISGNGLDGANDGGTGGGGGAVDLIKEFERRRELNALEQNELKKELEDLQIFYDEKKILFEKNQLDLTKLLQFYLEKRKEIEEKYNREESSRITAPLPTLPLPKEVKRTERDIQREALEVFRLRQEIDELLFDQTEKSERKIQRFKLNQQIELYRKLLEIQRKGGEILTNEEIARYTALIPVLQNILGKIPDDDGTGGKEGKKSIINSIFPGLSSDELAALDIAIEHASNSLRQFYDLKAELYQQDVDRANAAFDAAQKNYDQQVELAKEGYANQLDTAAKELALAKRQQEATRKQQEKFERAQLAANTALEASNLTLAITHVLKTLTFPLNILAVGTMLTAFTAAKIKAFQLSKKRFGKGGLIDVQGGSHASGNDTPLGIQVQGQPAYVERGEKVGVFSKRAVQQYGSGLSRIVDDLNNGTYIDRAGVSRRALDDIPPIIQANTNTQVMEDYLRRIAQQGETREYIDGDYRITIKGNRTTRTRIR